MRPALRAGCAAAAIGALHGLARAVDASLGVLLHTSLAVPDLALRAVRLVDAREAGLWAAGGAAVSVALGLLLRRRSAFWSAMSPTAVAPAPTVGATSALAAAAPSIVACTPAARAAAGPSRPAASTAEASPLWPLLLRPLLTLLALLSVALEPRYPWAFTLPVALTQDLGPAQDLLALALLLATVSCPARGGRSWRWRWGAPRAFDLFLLSFVAHVWLTPSWAWHWDNHPGNEPKTLRMALALGHFGSLDTEPVSAPMEDLAVQPLGEALGEVAETVAVESARAGQALLQGGPEALGASSIRATREARQTVRGKQGGIFHVLSPGPSLLLAPTLRLDRELNRALGTRGRLGISVLLFCGLAAALVSALFLLLREATGRSGLSAALAGFFALTPPFLFYPYQFYPEMLAALALALLWRFLLFGRGWSGLGLLGHSLLLASLPWLHQKFLPIWGVLVLHAVLVAVWRQVRLGNLVHLLWPQLLSFYFFLLWNFAITGSARPDALFLAWGPAGVSGARIFEGLAGLGFDLRYGLLPWAPVYLLGLAGLALPRRAARGGGAPLGAGDDFHHGLPGPLRLALPSAAVYYATVASADNWSGAICMLGRYAMPVTPLVIAGLGVLLFRAATRRGLLAIALALFGWTALLAAPLHLDPHAANDCALLAARSSLADPALYVPHLFFRTPGSERPVQRARTALWLTALAALALFSRRAVGAVSSGSHFAQRPLGSGLGFLAAILGLAFVCERIDSPQREGPIWSDLVEAPGGVRAYVGQVQERVGRTIVVSPGERSVLVVSREPLAALRVMISGARALKLADRPPATLLAAGAPVDAPLSPLTELEGRGGAREWFYRLTFETEGSPRIELRFDGGKSQSPP